MKLVPPNHAGSRRRDWAFTLLEIMVAITIFSGVMVAIYSSWLTIVRSSKTALSVAARVQRARMATRTLVDSLLCIQSFGANSAYYSFLADNTGDFTKLIFTSHLPPSFPDAGLFGDQYLRRIGFAVEAAKNGDRQLVLFQMPLLDDLVEDDEPFKIVLAREVSLFLVEFWDTRRAKWDPDWKLTNQLPKLVRVTLGCGPVNAATKAPQTLVSRVVPLPAMVVPAAYQLAPGRITGGPTNLPGNRPLNPADNRRTPGGDTSLRQF